LVFIIQTCRRMKFTFVRHNTRREGGGSRSKREVLLVSLNQLSCASLPGGILSRSQHQVSNRS
jgi:hypothetical protein